MITVVMMNNASDNNVVDKVVTTINTVSCALKDPTELRRPVLRLAGDSIVSGTNYCWIEALGRFYFTGEKTQLTAGIVELQLHVDVLMSFKESMRRSRALVEVVGNAVNPYIESEIWTPDVRRTTHVKNFSSGFNNTPEYVLLTAGAMAE